MVMSSMANSHRSRSQAVISAGVGHRRFPQLQTALNRFRHLRGVQTRQYVEDVFGAKRPGLDGQLYGCQQRI